MARRTTDRVVLARPADLREKLGDDKAVGRFLYVLSICPPPEIVNLVDILVRAVEQGDVLLQERLGRIVRDMVYMPLLVVPVELIDVPLQGVRIQYKRFAGRIRDLASCGYEGKQDASNGYVPCSPGHEVFLLPEESFFVSSLSLCVSPRDRSVSYAVSAAAMEYQKTYGNPLRQPSARSRQAGKTARAGP